MSSTTAWKENFTKFLKGRGKIQQWAELTAVQNLIQQSSQNLRNQQIESEAYARVMGSEPQPPQEGTQADDMVVLGDITMMQPSPQPPAAATKPSNLLGLAAILLSGGSLLVAGGTALGYLMSKPTAAQKQPSFEDESVTIGLGQYDDYFPKDGDASDGSGEP